MYCPKCKQTFAEGSRRFCPTDGARLVTESTAEIPKRSGGIFANLLPKIKADSGFDEKLADNPGKVGTRSPQSFDIEDIGKPDRVDAPTPEPQSEPQKIESTGHRPADLSPRVKKVSASEITTGHGGYGDDEITLDLIRDIEESNPEQLLGRVIKGRYKVISFFGGDESRFTYLAEDRLVENKKVLLRILIEDEYDEIMGSILAEERVSLSHLSHPNIARLIDSGQFIDGTIFLVNEYVDALSVNEILTIHRKFDDIRTAHVVKQAANALNSAHQEGILHRDLKPENLIIVTSGSRPERAKVVNFGASSGGLTPFNVIYKAPEVLEGRIATISSDIYSLAVIAFQMLTGRLPFAGSTKKELVRAQTAELKTRPSELNPELPSLVDAVMQKALAYNPADRYHHARDFGDALYASLSQPRQPVTASAVSKSIPIVPVKPIEEPTIATERADANYIVLEPEATSKTPVGQPSDQPAWRQRSPEPPESGYHKGKIIGAIGLLAMIGLFVFGFYYLAPEQSEPGTEPRNEQLSAVNNIELSNSRLVSNTEMPPLARNIPQPPNTSYYENSKINLNGDLLRNFVGFTVFYPKDWEINGPQSGTSADSRGKFLDISSSTSDGRLKEQMLVSYYASKGTFNGDLEKFPDLVKETNEVLTSLLPEYKMISEGEIKINGEWRAYEVKFQGSGTSNSGEKLVVWGRRLFMPAARPGVRNGFEITMLATSLANEVSGVNDVGVRGELAAILYSFEPSQNF